MPNVSKTYEQLCPDPAKMCVYDENGDGDSVRILKKNQVRDDVLVYEGDINGDGFKDRFEGRFADGVGTGVFSYGSAGSGSAYRQPASFVNAVGAQFAIGQNVSLGGSAKGAIAAFRLWVKSPYGAKVPEYAYVAVTAILKSGETYNIDQLKRAES